ncbi:UbiA family prenyltransferase [Rhodohalobacter sp. 8-1]|uniref:UbiA family prenyltransferase n=1 Tax=Rhodohalobacter sp. 8-1 TaxID=3131972 RepID=UPI0030ECBDD4
MLKEIYHFIIHLRLHYQVLILSGGYLLGGFLSGEMDTLSYGLQFINVHVLLFGGATAYNSWWDKDEGPIGGLRNPPKMTRWMHPLSLLFMAAGLFFATTMGTIYALIFLCSLILFWLYSTPLARWKGDPHLSVVAIAISTGFNSVLMGTLAAGGAISLSIVLGATGASLILISMYPVSQIFQIKEDRMRNDETFAIRYGVSGVKTFFRFTFVGGSLLLCLAIAISDLLTALLLFAGIAISGMLIATIINRLEGDSEDYRNVMKTKFLASLSFVSFFLIGNIIKYGWM